jgi:hypothetical protein
MKRSNKIFLLLFNAAFVVLAIWGILTASRLGPFTLRPDQYQGRVEKINNTNDINKLKQQANAYLGLLADSEKLNDSAITVIKKAMMGFIIIGSVNGLFLLLSSRRESKG